MIATDKGNVAIETIVEGTRVLTHAHGQRFGVTSDEDVTVTAEDEFLVGFSKRPIPILPS